jgi:HEPN domain-containing protein
MSDLDHARLLFSMAANDLRALKGMLRSEDAADRYFTDEIFGFHAQQCVEKSLKAWIAALDETYPKTHNINILLQILDTVGADVSPFDSLVDLNSFAVQFRYESLLDYDESLNREALIEDVEKLFECVSNILDT